MRKRAIVGCFCLLWLGAGPPARGENLLLNGDFDFGLEWWGFDGGVEPSWSATDGANSPDSGSLRLLNVAPTDSGTAPGASQCVELSGEKALTARTSVHIPPDQDREVRAELVILFFATPTCGGAFFAHGSTGQVLLPEGGWHPLELVVAVPAAAQIAKLHVGIRKIGDGGSVAGHFDDVSVEGSDPAPPGAWNSDPELAGFEFQVRIGGERIGRVENECIRETVCLSGALRGRSEVFLRIVGPKPNGYLWPTIVKFSTAEVEVWLRQTDSGIVKYYNLRGASPGFDELPGLFDRFGFLP